MGILLAQSSSTYDLSSWHYAFLTSSSQRICAVVSTGHWYPISTSMGGVTNVLEVMGFVSEHNTSPNFSLRRKVLPLLHNLSLSTTRSLDRPLFSCLQPHKQR